MNLSDLIHKVWKDERIRELKIRKTEVKAVIEVMIDYIIWGLLEYGKLKMIGLFSLEIRKAKGRKIGNPNNGEHMYIDDYYKVNITPSKKLKEGMKKLKK